MSVASDPLLESRLRWLLSDVRRVFAGKTRLLLASLPALLVGVTAILLGVFVATTSEDARLAIYVREAPLRFEGRDLDAALVCYERLIQDLGGQPQHRFATAMIYKEKGDRARADSILHQLAPVERPGYPPAHLELALELLGGTDRSVRNTKALEIHLIHALGGPDGDEAGIILGQLYAATGRGNTAEPYLRRVVARHPEVLLLLARIAHDGGDERKTREILDQAVRVFRKRVEARIDDAEARLCWAAALALRDDFAGAVSLLDRGLQLSADRRYPPAIASVYAAWALRLSRDSSASPGDRLSLLERGLRHDPNNQVLLRMLAETLRAGGPEAQRVRVSLQKFLTDGKSTAAIHFVLGIDASTRGRAAEAQMHWEQAFRLNPGMSVVANNLAWVLAHEDPPDLRRALELAERAVRAEPNDTRFRGTRGTIFLKLERWSEALTDLEAELSASPDRADTHLALAKVYDHLGSPDLAAKHRARAAERDKPAP
jgi:tetratricopeptide (TPR) repeat protein